MRTSDTRDTLKSMTHVELEQEVKDLKQELWKLRFQLATNQLENPMKLVEVKKSIAMAKTILRERELKGIAE